MDKRGSALGVVVVLVAALGAWAVPRWTGGASASAAKATGSASAAPAGGDAASPRAAIAPAPASDRLARQFEDLMQKAAGVSIPSSGDVPRRAEAVADAYRRRGSRELRALVVSLPDPRQSHLALYYGQVLESLRRAFASAGYVQDRFWLGDLEPRAIDPRSIGSSGNQRDRDASDESSAERLPGLVFFRSVRPDGSEKMALAVIVTESPVFGPDARQLDVALRFAGAIEPPGASMGVLGPFFSGSAHALAAAIRSLDGGSGASPALSVVTGSATASSVDRELGALGARAAFRRTVVADEVLEGWLMRILGAGDPAYPNKVAVLSELGTGYGDTAGGQAPGAAPDPTHGGRPAVPRYHFPLHIAEVRADHERAAGAGAGADAFPTLRRTLGLRFDPSEGHEADLPDTHSDLTPYEDDLTLAQTLESIQDRGVQFLLVKATDPVDVVFLGGEIRKYCPDVTLALIEHEEMFVHPDLGSTFFGAVVASTYAPSFAAADAFDHGVEASGAPFPNSLSQGVFNAALTLFAASGVAPEADRRRVGYACEADSGACGPEVFVAQIAGLRYWPLHAAFAPQPGDTRRSATPSRPHLPSDRVARFFLWPALFVAAGHAIARRRGRDAPGVRGARRRSVLAVADASLAGLVALTAAPFAAEWRFASAFQTMTPHRFATVTFAAVAGAGTSAALALAAIQGLASAAKSGRDASADSCALPEDERDAAGASRARVARTAHVIAIVSAATAALLAIGWAVACVLAPAAACAGGGDPGAPLEALPGAAVVLGLLRLDAPLAMSTATPLVVLGAAFYLWSICALRRADRLDRFPECMPCPSEWCDANDPVRRSLDRCWRLLCAPWSAAHLGIGCIAAPAVTFGVWRFFLRFKGTFDEPSYRYVFGISAVLLAAFVAAALFRFVTLSGALLAFLRRLAAEPMRDAYDRIAEKVSGSFGLQLQARVPDAADLAVSVLSCRGLSSLEPGRGHAALAGAASAVEHAFRAMTEGEANGDADGVRPADREAATHREFFRAAVVLRAILIEVWNRRARTPDLAQTVRELPPKDLLPGGDRAAIPTPALLMAAMPHVEYLWLRAAEDFVALRLSTLVYQVLHELRAALTFTLLASFLLVVSLNAYPFRPAHFMTTVGWSIVVVQVVIALYRILQFERNEVLSRLGRTRPERIEWNASFVHQIFLYVALPLAAALVGLFPDLGDWVTGILSPVARAVSAGN
jgi:hypothetical protein